MLFDLNTLGIMKYLSVIVFLLFTMGSCQKDSESDFESENEEQIFQGAFGNNDEESANLELGNYMLFGYYTDFVIRLDVTEISSGEEAGWVLTNYTPSPGMPSVDAGRVKANQLEFNWNPSHDRYESELGGDELTTFLKEECFGNNVSFSVNRTGFDFFNEMYIPEEIKIQSISHNGIVEGSYTQKIDRDNLQLSWNEDINNNNGVLAFVRWDGTMNDSSLGEVLDNEWQENSIVFPDTGSATIPSSLFDNIPKDARVDFNLIRANFEIKNGIDGRSYKTYGISFSKRKFLLIN